MVIVYCDMLGVRSRWHDSGRDGAEAAFRALHDVASGALGSVQELQIQTAIEGDSAVFLCPDAEAAVPLGRALFAWAFGYRTNEVERVWLRGCIVDAPNVQALDDLRLVVDIDTGHGVLREFAIGAPLLEAIAVERGGYKGMRLLIESDLVTAQLRRAHRIPVGDGYLIPFRRLDHSTYPGRLSDGYQDILWMASNDERTWAERKERMARRLRESAGASEESLHAAATQVLFHECDAIVHSLTRRLGSGVARPQVG